MPEQLSIMLAADGVALRALDDAGEGEDAEDMRVIKSLFSRRDQRDRSRKSRRGKRDKARRGEVLGAALQPRYGFEYVRNERGKAVAYAVDPEKMKHVRRIFTMLAEGASIHEVSREFEQGGMPAPSGGASWSRTTIRNMVVEDVYRPHAYEELTGMVPADVLAGLDPEKVYGISWFGKRKTSYTPGKKSRKVEVAPREDWIAVPVCLDGSGLEYGTVDRARAAVKDNRPTSKAGDQVWELSGVLFCGECGRRMIAYRRATQNVDYPSGYYHYYRCRPSSTLAQCQNRRSHRAEQLEHQAAMTFGQYASRETLLELYDKAVEERESRTGLRDSLERHAALSEKLSELELERRGYLRQNARGVLPDSDLDAMLAELDEQREAVAAEFRASEDRAAEAERLRTARDTLMASYDPVHAEWYEDPDAVTPDIYLSISAKPEEVRRAYRRYGTRFELSADGTLTLRLKLDLSTEPLHSERTY
ncbi:hypothetical protein AVDCRST_MAG82-2100 [uncultured Rubrobacteraceae bacterium]|uniref:Recombinase domain-containing protein n=1 Tax=uncultured Rubrobacteraceae bacterium TaxID=349277 RepID=A0A6J4Q241_9ACTN|nr:hypothetical protein AVDCRST_MAG82-2100 [uncultured Rubrobacteraceae bacterium]